MGTFLHQLTKALPATERQATNMEILCDLTATLLKNTYTRVKTWFKHRLQVIYRA